MSSSRLARSRFFPYYSEQEILRRLYNIKAYHHYAPPLTTPMYQLLYDSTLLIKDLKEAQKAQEKAHKEAQMRNAQTAALNRTKRPTRRYR